MDGFPTSEIREATESAQLQELGFCSVEQELLAGEALQRITASRPTATVTA